MEPQFTLVFREVAAQDIPLVGGKGANLGELARAGFRVPPGFCITTAGFDAFLEGAPAMESYYARLSRMGSDDLEGVRQLGGELRSYLQQIEMPKPVAAAIAAAWRTLGTWEAYAVRSSATAEDLPTASFAGQQDTFLNVRTETALLDRVRACWVSLFTDRAILYRAQNGFDHRQGRLSVVVQQMVFPQVSGILFSADPVSGHRRIASIDASFGLGEALVSGLVSADLYRVDKRSWQVVEARVGDKQLAVHPDPDGGTLQEALGPEQRQARVLSDGQAVELARLGASIEDHYGAPQDIEWALADDEIYVLQSRPITSLFPLPPQDGRLRVYFSFSHAQVMTDAMSPMGISIWKLLFPFGRADDAIGYNPFLHGVGGRMYVDISPMLNTYLGRRAIPAALMAADALSGIALREFVQRPEFLSFAEEATQKASLRGLLHWLGPLVPRAIYRLLLAPPETALPTVEQHIENSLAASRAELAGPPAGLPRLKAAFAFTSATFVENAKSLIPYVMAIMMSKTILERLAGDRADPADLNAVYSGLEGNVTTNMDLEVGDLTDTLRRFPAVAELVRSTDPVLVMERLEAVEGGRMFEAQLREFLRKYGMRGPSEIDIARPRWNDNPQSLLQMVISGVGLSKEGVHREHFRRLVADSKQATERVIGSVRRSRFGMLKAPLARRMIAVYRSHMVVREHPKFMLIKMFDMVQEVLLDAAGRLVEAGRLDVAADIWNLEFDEVIRALEQEEMDLRPLVASRRADLRHFQGLRPPRLFTSDGEQLKATYATDHMPAGAVPGSPVSAGVAEGSARVVTDPARETLLPGEILVAPFTDPGWTPLFINAAGLVMEVGGLMTHGSVVAREYGIPAVVGVPDATQRFKTGQRLRVDGDGGFVEVLEA